jgi:glycerol-3-phosphate responsive antiterminator
MRDKRSEISRAFEEEDARIKAQQDEVAAAMKDIIKTAGGVGMRTIYGTVTLKTNTRYYAQDWEAMYRFIVDNEAPHLLEKRIAQKNMTEFLEANPGIVPTGLNTMSEITVSVTKPRS